METELLTNMSIEELTALAEARLAPGAQSELNDLLDRNREQTISAAEITKLDLLLQQADQLTILKSRAQYTLGRNLGLSVMP